MKTVTVKQANDVRNAVETQFKSYVDATQSRPSLHRDYTWYTWPGAPIPWALVWEEGPYEWALNAFTEHTDEELAGWLDVSGLDTKSAVVKAVAVPSGVAVEPLTSFILAVYSEG